MPKTSTNGLPAPVPPEQRSFKARGGGDEQFIFEIYQRQNIQDDADFSCGIVHVALDGSRLTLARYNGPGHEHGDILYRPHVHRATEKAIASGRKPEREAEETDRSTFYDDLADLLKSLIDEDKIRADYVPEEVPNPEVYPKLLQRAA